MKPSAIKGQITRLNKELATLKPGQLMVKKKLHADVYHGAAGVSTSRLKLFIQCPAKYKAQYITGELVPPKSDAFDLGSAAHGLLLEPQKFNSEFVIQPERIKTRRGKAWDEFQEQNVGRTVIRRHDWEHCHAIREAVLSHPFGNKLLSGGTSEISYFKRDEQTGLIIKCRADYILGDLIVDLKTTVSAAPDDFRRSALRLNYHLQDAIYRDIIGLQEFAFLAVEKEAPYVVTAPIMFDEDARRLGFLKYRKALNDLADAIAFDHFPGYSSDPVVMDLTPWDKKELEQLEGAA